MLLWCRLLENTAHFSSETKSLFSASFISGVPITKRLAAQAQTVLGQGAADLIHCGCADRARHGRWRPVAACRAIPMTRTAATSKRRSAA